MKNKPGTIKFGELTDHTGYHIRRAHSAFMRLFAKVGKRFNLRSQQSSILILARENPGISPAAVSQAIGIERSLMARLLADLSERGFISSKSSEQDGRQKGLYITASGKKYINKVLNSFRANLEPELTQKLTENEKKTLIRLLKKIYLPG